MQYFYLLFIYKMYSSNTQHDYDRGRVSTAVCQGRRLARKQLYEQYGGQLMAICLRYV